MTIDQCSLFVMLNPGLFGRALKPGVLGLLVVRPSPRIGLLAGAKTDSRSKYPGSPPFSLKLVTLIGGGRRRRSGSTL